MPDQSDAPKNQRPFRDLLRWLALAPLAFVLLLGCGQLALLGAGHPAAPDTRSNLRADYRPWPYAVIPAVNPAIIDDLRRDEHINSTVVARPFWPTTTPASHPATPAPRPTQIAERSTATATRERASATPLPFATATPSPVPTRRPTITVTRQPVPTLTPTSTPTDLPTATDTLTPAPTHRPTRTPRPIETATDTPTPIDTSTPTVTPVPIDTFTPTATATPTPTETATGTPTSTPTPTPTATDTVTPTPTATWELCNGSTPSGEPDIGSPDGDYATVACETYLTIDLDAYAAPHVTSHAGYDFVYFEQATFQPPCTGICLDWVRVDVSADNVNWITVFNWGDGQPDDNTNIAAYSGGSEDDNLPIPAGDLYCDNGYCSGIAIDVDAKGTVPLDGYRYIRFWSPLNPNGDGSEVDAVLVFP